MKKYITLLLLVVISICYSCTKDGIDTYGNINYVSFVKNQNDTTKFSFFFYIKDEVEYPIQVKLIGNFLTEDTDFYIKVDDAKTTLDKELYTIPDKFTFRANQLLDTIYIKLKNRPDLLTNKYILKLNIEDGVNILSSNGPYGTTVLYVSDMAERPEWWTLMDPPGNDGPWDLTSIEYAYLGVFTKEKYEAFMKATGESDLSGWSHSELRSISLKFSHWLKEQVPALLEANGDLIEVEVIG